ncbi:SDR family NAD(P)-dependent oxidoreductase [Frankia nepalensis]|uniref:SDR family NAD(P)-dependent oxidoreductase n=1 Tax=Frankia nepalensis TaxID=1836974 RepID=UPI002551CAE4|nr:SDR family NAD(P)-dependent oxidoreductase [Frankia nepalensis]
MAAATTLAADGANVAIVGRDATRAREAAVKLGAGQSGTVVGLAGDLETAGEAERAVAAAVEAFGGLRGMAVTTGLGPRGRRPVLDAEDADWEHTFTDVVLTTVRACRADIQALAELVGVERILFGSDWPHGEGLAEPTDFVKELHGFDDAAVRRIMRDNALELLGVESL